MFVRVASVTELKPGEGKTILSNGKEIALFNAGGNFFAIQNECPHRGGPLGEGILSDTSVICPLHAWMFDLKTGGCINNPGKTIKTFPVKIEGSDVMVDL